MAGFRNRDMQVERELAAFMDHYLYSNGQFSKHERTDEKADQLKGSDIILSIPSLGLVDVVVDEKGMTQYMTKPLPTFSLELSFLNYGNVVTGWFVDDTKSTEYYMFLWPKAKVDWNATENDFCEVEYMLVSKKSLRDFFEKEGLSKEQLNKKASEIRARGGDGGPIDKDPNKDYYFYYTTKLVEKPINLIVRKKLYKQLAIMSGIVKP